MTLRAVITGWTENERLNFLVTNRIPRRILTRFMGWFSKIELAPIRHPSIAIFRAVCAPNLAEAKKQSFRSLHDCFIRELAAGARSIDPRQNVLISPCDGIVGAAGAIRGNTLMQVKGFAYTLEELLREPALAARYHNGSYVTLRLTAGMYHRFHAPDRCRARRVTHIPGDAWNVNPPALKRIDRLYCRNERAVLSLELAGERGTLTLVAVAAVLVAGIRLRFLSLPFERNSPVPTAISCDATFEKGEELGWFEHGSTILVLAPAGFELTQNVSEGALIQMGEPLLVAPG
ncbi:MAG TPA: archaetidylserine decarboxylase [Hyphomicrobiaceae bacterium]|nr:archaetidylserine decarboxylase [Hyphomicrobiaceae bacterium]